MSAHHEVEVVIGNHPCRLCYTMAAFRRLRAQGLDLLHATEADGHSLADVALLGPIVWAGLMEANRATYPTVEALEEALVPADLPRLMAAVTEAFQRANQAELAGPTDPLP